LTGPASNAAIHHPRTGANLSNPMESLRCPALSEVPILPMPEEAVRRLSPQGRTHAKICDKEQLADQGFHR